MARTNLAVARPPLVTHEGAPAHPATRDPLIALRRSVCSCLLWEDEFYESGEQIATRIQKLAQMVRPEQLAALAVEARVRWKLRHVPLLLLATLADTGRGLPLVAEAIESGVRRVDELAELLAIRAKITGKPLKKALTHGMRKGLARAFTKFDAYQLAKWNRDGAIKLRDALFLVHAKPKDAAQAEVWKKLVDGTLPAPDTWEVALSGGANKRETFTRLLVEGKLGYLALLRNLRGMAEAKVDVDLIRDAIVSGKGADHVLPFRYVAAARAAPQFEPYLDEALIASLKHLDQLPGRTVVLVDVSRSMLSNLSAKSDLTRLDAAATLAAIVPGDVRMFSFSERLVEVPPRRGMAGIDAIRNSQPYSGTLLFDAVQQINRTVPYDRLVVITDEQATDPRKVGYLLQVTPGGPRTLPPPREGAVGYMINVASAANGVGYGPWVHIDGWSEHALRFIAEHERQ